jgi:Zn-finger nucleic acid-binding protein
VSECAECGGLWVDPAILQTLCNDREHHTAVIATLSARAAPRAAIADVVRYVPCPACAKLMNRTNFSHISGVIIDVCRNHGIWLDRGELEHIIAFVESGGLAKQREREIEQLADESRRLRALEARSGNTTYPPDNPQLMPLRGGLAQAESMDGVLAALAGLLHS